MLLVCAFVFFFGLCQGVSEASQCTANGRFSNDGEGISDCRSFSICIQGAGGVFIQRDLQCPPPFIFNHIDDKCTNATTYQCLPDFNCIYAGTFVDHSSPNCSSYIECVKALTNTITARLIVCPPDTLFSTVEGVCVDSSAYECHPQGPETAPDIRSVETTPESKAFGKDSANSNFRTSVQFTTLLCSIGFIVL